MRPRCTKWLPFAFASLSLGCAEMEGDVGQQDDEVVTENGLATTNGLACANGLATTNGLMTTAAGRNQVAYIVRCALPVNTSITKGSYTFQGLLGLAPQWENGSCDANCQEAVSACLLAHVNTAGLHIPLWIVAQNPIVGWGQDPEFPNQEASFFGNVFVPGAHGTDPTKTPGYYCTGSKYSVNPPKGRIGGTQTTPPYINPFGTTMASCAGRCTEADYPNGAHGFKACNGWNNVVTVWRQNTISTTTKPSGGSGRGFRWR